MINVTTITKEERQSLLEVSDKANELFQEAIKKEIARLERPRDKGGTAMESVSEALKEKYFYRREFMYCKLDWNPKRRPYQIPKGWLGNYFGDGGTTLGEDNFIYADVLTGKIYISGSLQR